MSGSLLDEWVAKAEQDYRAAVTLDPDDTPDVICFHCQQCIEKYLKAAMVTRGIRVERTHDLLELKDLLYSGANSSLSSDAAAYGALFDDLDLLQGYAVNIRYPGTHAAADEPRRALATMQGLRTSLRCLLGLEAPQPPVVAEPSPEPSPDEQSEVT